MNHGRRDKAIARTADDSPGRTVSCLEPISAPSIKTVILGSMPGIASLRALQYYAHPRNAFWSLVSDVFGVSVDQPYPLRCQELREKGIGLWDVLAKCVRPGSLDSDIKDDSAVANDLEGWLEGQPVRVIGLNGSVAAKMYERHCAPGLARRISDERIKVVKLPSSSPANARLDYQAKLASWRKLAEGEG